MPNISVQALSAFHHPVKSSLSKQNFFHSLPYHFRFSTRTGHSLVSRISWLDWLDRCEFFSISVAVLKCAGCNRRPSRLDEFWRANTFFEVIIYTEKKYSTRYVKSSRFCILKQLSYLASNVSISELYKKGTNKNKTFRNNELSYITLASKIDR